MTTEEEVRGGPEVRGRAGWAALALLVLAAGLRFWRLGYTWLWIDEITVKLFALAHPSLGAIVRSIHTAEFGGYTGQHMPFQYVLVHAWRAGATAVGAPFSEAVMRFPFALLGTLVAPLCYLAARRVFDRRLALYAGLLTALSWFQIYQSRDATSYAPLLFFQGLQLWALAHWAGPAKLRWRAAVGWGALFTVATAGMLWTHLTAWLWLGALGLVLVGAILWRGYDARVAGAPRALGRDRLLIPLGLMVLAALPFLRFLFQAMRGAGAAGSVAQPLGFTWWSYQLAHFGWGQGGGRLTVFLALTVLGLAGLLRDARRRRRGLLLLGLMLWPAIFFSIVLYRDASPRYLSIVHLPLLVGAAAGLSAGEELLRRRGGRRAPAMIWGARAALLLLWVGCSLGPYRALYTLTDKLYPMSRVRDWLVEQTAPDTPFVWQNGNHLREVGREYIVPRRPALYGGFSNSEKPEDALRYRSENTRATFERLPQAVLIFDRSDVEFDPRYWGWINTYFARVASIPTPDTLARLQRWGLNPHGPYSDASRPRFVALWNPRETTLARRRQAGETVALWPEGRDWEFVQMQGDLVWAEPRDQAALVAHNLTDKAQAGRLIIEGVCGQPGQLEVLPAGGPRLPPLPLQPTGERLGRWQTPVFELPVGTQRIRLAVWPAQVQPAVLYIMTARWEPAAAAPGE